MDACQHDDCAKASMQVAPDKGHCPLVNENTVMLSRGLPFLW